MSALTQLVTPLYGSVANHYHAMVQPDTRAGLITANRDMAAELSRLPNGARIIDAACGVGYDAIAIAKGLPLILPAGTRKQFEVAASDFSSAMALKAQQNIAEFVAKGDDIQIDVRQGALTDLRDKPDWLNRFDAAIAPNMASELFPGLALEDYDNHIVTSLQSVGEILKSGGLLLIDVRDWEQTVKIIPPRTRREYTHNEQGGAVRYTTRYDWKFAASVDGEHTAHTTFSARPEGQSEDIVLGENPIRFAGKTTEQLHELFGLAGFNVLRRTPQTRGPDKEPFNLFVLENTR